MVDLGEGVGPIDDREALLRLAWKLKDIGYAAWSTEPQRVDKAADALDRLVTHARRGGAGPPIVTEVEGVHEWIAGIADLVGGRMTGAIRRFGVANERFGRVGLEHEAVLTQVPKIVALSILGRHVEAAAFGERTQADLQRLGDVAAASRVSLNLGNLYCRCNDYPRALKHYREATVLFARVGDRERSIMADIGMADTLVSTGDFGEAMRIYARARMRSERHGFPVLLALVDESAALMALARGEYRQALAGLERSRRCYEALEMPQHLATAEKQLADAYLELRLLPEALALFDRALPRFETLEMPVERAWALAQKGRVLLELGRPAALVDEVLILAARLFGEQQIAAGEAAVLLARAELAIRSEAPGDATDLARRASGRFEAAGLVEGRVRSDVVVAYALLRGGHAVAAGALFDATLARSRALGLISMEVRCLAGQGLAALAAGDEESARSAFRLSIAGFEAQRRALPGDEIRSVFLTDHLRPYEELLRLALAEHARAPSTERAIDALLALESFRARVLDDRLGERAADASRTADDEETETLRTRLNWLYRRLRRGEEEAETIDDLAGEARRAEHELLERARRDRFVDHADRIAAGEGAGLDPVALQRLLTADDVVVEYGSLDDRLFAFVVTCDRIDLVDCPAPWSDVVDAVRSARFQIDALKHGSIPVERHLDMLTRRMQARMTRLHELVWAPIAALVGGHANVMIVPHAQLASVPFAALQDDVVGTLARHTLALAPSAQVAIRTLSRLAAPPRRALVIGESTYLPHAAAEARHVGTLFPEATMLVGSQATIAAVCANAVTANVIHMACHAAFRADNPMFSALHLADGALTVEQVERLVLKSATVVLSACETGLADTGRGDETIGLVRAFLLAGAARVVASLWPVDDAVTSAFMAVFYRGLCAGERPGDALRVAQQAIRRTHPHPVHWAAFALYGGW